MPQPRVRDPWYRLMSCKNPDALSRIEVQGCDLESVPDLTIFVNLSKVYLGRNHLSHLPASFGHLPALTALYLGSNHFEDLPPALASLGNSLTTLHIFKNRLTTLNADVIAALPRLVTLNINHNSLAMLPPALGTLQHLESLSATHNQLTALPEELGSAAALSELIVTANSIRRIPASFGQLSQLRRCVAVGNRINTLPLQLLKCPKLTELDLSANEIPFCTSDGFAAMCKLPRFYVDGNKFVKPLPPDMEALIGGIPPSLREMCSRALSTRLPEKGVAVWEATNEQTRTIRQRSCQCPVCKGPIVDHFISTVKYANGGATIEKVPIEAKLCSYACLLKRRRTYFVTAITLHTGQYAFRASLLSPQAAPDPPPTRRRSRVEMFNETVAELPASPVLPQHWSSPSSD